MGRSAKNNSRAATRRALMGLLPRHLGRHPAMWLCALVEIRRIEVLALHGADRTRHIAIANIRDARQRGSEVEQECVTACHSQRPSRLEHGAELGVGKRDRRHAAGPRWAPGIRDLASLSKTLARNRKPCTGEIPTIVLATGRDFLAGWVTIVRVVCQRRPACMRSLRAWCFSQPAPSRRRRLRIVGRSPTRLSAYDATTGRTCRRPRNLRHHRDPLRQQKIHSSPRRRRVKQQLLDADSARFQDVKIKTVGGKKGICGQVNAKNSTGGMTGFLPFAYDGEYATIMVFNAGPGNPTSMGSDILGVTLGRRLEAHDRFCK
jgi:hypothetical protein